MIRPYTRVMRCLMKLVSMDWRRGKQTRLSTEEAVSKLKCLGYVRNNNRLIDHT